MPIMPKHPTHNPSQRASRAACLQQRGHDIPSEAPELTQKKSVILRRKESLFGLQMLEISTEMAEVGGGERAQLMMQRGAMALLPAHSCSL